MFSSGLFGGIGRASGGGYSGFDAEAKVPGLLSQAGSFNDALDLFYISVGEQDPRIGPTRRAVEILRSGGLEVELATFPGDHEWRVWRSSLHDMARRLFR